HIGTYNHKGAVNISRSDKEITEEDRTHVLEAARQMRISNDREIIETIPLGYTVDKQKGVPNPIGMEGSHLGVNVHLVTASTMILNNIYKCVNRAGFRINGVAYGLLALGDAVVMPEEKELGVVLVDIGGHVTDIAIYVMGGVCYTHELTIGGDYITRDIAYGMRTSFEHARTLKEQFGMACSSSLIERDEDVDFYGVDGITPKKTKVSQLHDIIHPRVEEIMKMVKQSILSSEFENAIPAGIILTGGTAKLKGICEVAESVFKMPVRLGISQGFDGRAELTGDLRNSTVLGLSTYIDSGNLGREARNKKQSFLDKIKKFIEEIF
ncbi:cell division protein FtsA, partial [bacterium]